MRASIYLNYTTRSLWRGGQRTVLAIFCIAVGVMSIVALQLVGQMIANSYSSNTREANGGDITASSYSSGLKQSDLAFFDNLKTQGKISGYTSSLNVAGKLGSSLSSLNSFSIQVVDPSSYPLVGAFTFNAPASGRFSNLLQHRQVVMDQQLADQYNKKVGDALDVTLQGAKRVTMHLKLVGIVADSGPLQARQSVMFLSVQDFTALAAPPTGLKYSTVNVTVPVTDDTHINAVKQTISDQFPLMGVTTTTDLLKQRQDSISILKKFLAIAGLLALLIGGVGIVNTMQVLLTRRKIEIAMLKTTGYRRFDLYLLFGLEAALLGLLGGVIGAAAACGVSYLVAQVMQHVVSITIPFQLDPLIIGGGVLIGLCTALIFGLLPIVQAANIRPLNVIRDSQSGGVVSNVLLSIFLIALLSVLFCVMASIILNDTALAIGSVYGTFVVLVILSLLFSLAVYLIGRLPVPERFSIGYILLVGIPLLISIGLTLLLPAFGGILAFISLLGIIVVLLPRTWKANVKMALRNIGRTRGRTTTTLLALFVGVFTIGLILTLAQNLRAQIDKELAQVLTFNVAVSATDKDAQSLSAQSSTIPGLQHMEQHTYTSVVPVSVNDEPIASLFRAAQQNQKGQNTSYNDVAVDSVFLGSVEGYDLAHQQVPNNSAVIITQGRNLQASDAGTDNVLLASFLKSSPVFSSQLKLGSTLLLASDVGHKTHAVHVVGFYTSTGSTFGQILAPRETVASLASSGQGLSQAFYLKIDPNQIGRAVNKISTLAPNAGIENLADVGGYIDQYINNTLLMLTALASLSLLAGVIIIANAVALAMLERRRELGILKSVGYTSRSILSEVLVENGVVGGLGAILAMLLVTLATSLLGNLVFHTGFGVSWYIAIGLIAGVALLAILVAMLVAWNAVRVRPLEVLRYE